jgi:hypothetical protein
VIVPKLLVCWLTLSALAFVLPIVKSAGRSSLASLSGVPVRDA